LLFTDEKTFQWKQSSDTRGSKIRVSLSNNNCVTVPEDGLYQIISQITFGFDGNTKRNVAAQSITVKRRDTGLTELIQKKVVPVPFRDPNLHPSEKVVVSSNLLTFARARVGDEICVNVHPVELVYVSEVENALTVELKL